MAMIKCSKCQKEISDKATSCEHCSNLMVEVKNEENTNSFLNNFTLISWLCILNIILIFQSTFRLLNASFNIFDVSSLIRQVENTFGNIDIAYIALVNTVVNVILYTTLLIVLGFILSLILSLVKKEKRIFPIISSIAAILLNLLFITTSYIVSSVIKSEGLDQWVDFSTTIFPYLIVLVSSFILWFEVKNAIIAFKNRDRTKSRINVKKIITGTAISLVVLALLSSFAFSVSSQITDIAENADTMDDFVGQDIFDYVIETWGIQW
ncbi:MAG: hypothetical protein FWC79_00665 [Oscillospiraceae bacterium]|nr:hypothetical protein [Oscillospiraceae bacterium]